MHEHRNEYQHRSDDNKHHIDGSKHHSDFMGDPKNTKRPTEKQANGNHQEERQGQSFFFTGKKARRAAQIRKETGGRWTAGEKETKDARRGRQPAQS